METNAQQESEIKKVNVSLQNLGTVNKNKVVLGVNGKGTLTLYFSYETIVSFFVQSPSETYGRTIKNYWSQTTAKLLNEVCPDKAERLEREEFNKTLTNVFNNLL